MGMRLGNGRRRSRDAGFQWLMIGIVLGMGCAFSVFLAGYVFDIIEVSIDEETAEPTDVVYVTQVPDTPTMTAEVIVEETPSTPEETLPAATEQATPLPMAETQVTASSVDETAPVTGVSPTPTIGFTTNFDDTGSVQSSPTTAASVPVGGASPVQAVASPLMPVDAGTFKMGTTQADGQIAVAECVNRDSGTCDQSWILDSIPPHDVYVDAFQIEQYEVSVSQYVAFLNYLLDQNPGSRPHLSACNGGPCVLTVGDAGGENSDIAFNGERYSPRADGFDRANYPVTFVFWEGAKAYCESIGRYLPTEAQWERAARGPNNFYYPWGQQWEPGPANTSRSGVDGGTMEVTSFRDGASGYGALNMAGNVAEWTADYYSATIYQERANTGQVTNNPTGPSFGETVVIRGGAWDNTPFFARTVHRRDLAPNQPNASVGFRCAADPS